MTLPAITFAVPYHSGPDYLRSALRSVLAQTYPAWRLVVCDDGPEGSGGPVVAEFADPRVRYVRAPVGGGMAANWNRCLEQAETDLVTLLHADDELAPHYAAALTAAAVRHPDAATIFCRAHVIGPDGRPAFSFPDFVKRFLVPRRGRTLVLSGDSGLAALLRGNFIMCPTVCYRRSRLGGLRFDGRWKFVLDLDLYARLLLAGEQLVGIAETAYRYRRHAGNATVAYTESLLRFREEADLYGELAAAARGRDWLASARVADRRTIIRLHLGYRIARDVLTGRLSAARAKWRFARTLFDMDRRPGPLTPTRP